ncbi:hypothetical protein K435DRAFT_841131 [Dendrothele bispora CBS 962.96]|uniref:Uncharacterized protein n=1 Tax=Dendrothele bispora (strain CBS 962.96) TaxID=1314807 RepID=A0A4V4HEI8_DENBC|nr:hypothetical protein K435DRAFT_841131 [Dendrothele bispora CBS 962.96]
MPVSYPFDAISTDPSLFDSEPVSVPILQTEECGLCPQIKDCLEYNWSLRRGELDLDSTHNLVQVRADMPHQMESGLYFVPTPTTFQAILSQAAANDSHTRIPYTESFPIQDYEYILAPRCIDVPLYLRDPESGETQRFDHPYHGLPTFSSSVHPFHLAYNSISYGHVKSALHHLRCSRTIS